MTDSAKRIARTVYQIVVALVTITPALVTILADTPVEAQVGIFAGWVAVVAAIINKLEDAGVLPAWLKTGTTPTVITDAETVATKAAAFIAAHPNLSKLAKADLVAFVESIGKDSTGTKAALIKVIEDAATAETTE